VNVLKLYFTLLIFLNICSQNSCIFLILRSEALLYIIVLLIWTLFKLLSFYGFIFHHNWQNINSWEVEKIDQRFIYFAHPWEQIQWKAALYRTVCVYGSAPVRDWRERERGKNSSIARLATPTLYWPCYAAGLLDNRKMFLSKTCQCDDSVADIEVIRWNFPLSRFCSMRHHDEKSSQEEKNQFLQKLCTCPYAQRGDGKI
jgi:hypothetical protein